MNQLDYLILSSRNEGLPGVLLEALILRVPCINSKDTNIGSYMTDSFSGIMLKENAPIHIAREL
jgi:glycosyltransferase involved in cell wall biosynthesis